MYYIFGYEFFWNDNFNFSNVLRFYGGIVVYSKILYLFGYFYSYNIYGIEIIVIKVMICENWIILGIYCFLKIFVR